jgi:PhoPQ-activated pathogenicity-related protein
MVIDTLNMRVQMPRQLEALGAFSAELTPYSSRGLVPIPETPEGDRLLSLVDPWAYREKLKLPKLIINGTNDFYWATDALNVYWNDLPGNKWALYVPNAGHDMRRRDGMDSNPLSYLINGLAAFTRHQASGASMPSLTWKHEIVSDKLRLTVEAAPAPLKARLWVAHAPTADFRTARWKEQAANVSKPAVTGEVALPEEGYVAFFGELDYEIDGLKYRLSTQLRVEGKGAPDAK